MSEIKPLKIYFVPFSSLHEVAEEVIEINESIKNLAAGMIESMYAFKGIGLAANQVGILKRVIIVDEGAVDGRQEGHAHNHTEGGDCCKPIVAINPEILEHSEEVFFSEEGCLSLPGVSATAKRYNWVVVRYMTLDGEKVERKVEGLLGQIFQHEIDHLNGITLLHFAGSPLKKNVLLKKVQKYVKTHDMTHNLEIEDARIIYRDLL